MSERPGPRSDQTLNDSQLPQQAPLPPVALKRGTPVPRKRARLLDYNCRWLPRNESDDVPERIDAVSTNHIARIEPFVATPVTGA